MSLPAVMSEEIHHIDRSQAGTQVLHVHQDSKEDAASNVLTLLYQDD